MKSKIFVLLAVMAFLVSNLLAPAGTVKGEAENCNNGATLFSGDDNWKRLYIGEYVGCIPDWPPFEDAGVLNTSESIKYGDVTVSRINNASDDGVYIGIEIDGETKTLRYGPPLEDSNWVFSYFNVAWFAFQIKVPYQPSVYNPLGELNLVGPIFIGRNGAYEYKAQTQNTMEGTLYAWDGYYSPIASTQEEPWPSAYVSTYGVNNGGTIAVRAKAPLGQGGYTAQERLAYTVVDNPVSTALVWNYENPVVGIPYQLDNSTVLPQDGCERLEIVYSVSNSDDEYLPISAEDTVTFPDAGGWEIGVRVTCHQNYIKANWTAFAAWSSIGVQVGEAPKFSVFFPAINNN